MPGPNIINGTPQPDTIPGTPGDDIIYGNQGDDTLIGGGGKDELHGDWGADTMKGGADSDDYWVDSAFDIVVENKGEGDFDTIHTSVTYNISANVEDLYMEGGGDIDAFGNGLDNRIWGNSHDNSIWGGGGHDAIWGGGGNDHLYGGTGNDRLEGGAGADVLKGGRDNDMYFVADGFDTIIENANEGWDHVYVSNTTSYTLGANLEELSLQGQFVASLEGNELHNVIWGNSAFNRIDGRGGADDFYGLGGNDTFVFRAGEANGDAIYGFAGAAFGGTLEFQGYGPGAMAQHIQGSDQWVISSADGSIVETIFLIGNPTVDASDIHFV